VSEALEQMIVTGEFADASGCDEIRGCEQFMSRVPPLREAFQVWPHFRSVELVPRRGAFVRHPPSTR